MDEIKNRLGEELEELTLSQEKKRNIAQLAKEKVNVRPRSNWTYRIVLVMATILAISFSYTLIKKPIKNEELSTGATDRLIDLSFFFHPLIQSALLIMAFIIIGFMINRRYRKAGKDLPECVYCHEQWTFKESLRRGLNGNAMTCPYCKKKQYITRESARKLNYFTLAIPFGILLTWVPGLVNTFVMYLTFAFCLLMLMMYFTPYTIKLQKDDPLLKPLY